MGKGFFDLIRGQFLMNETASKNWLFIAYLSGLALVMISVSHRTDEKVHEISEKSTELKEIKSRYVDVRMQRMQLQLESEIIGRMEVRGLVPSNTPPTKIVIEED
ncbi:MAG TPA: FtsL-like putative cell division protein [Flavobacteriaceae bacterium]|nr:FtsL-like putative cell division protein [Flavobacteriaceae bacterium]